MTIEDRRRHLARQLERTEAELLRLDSLPPEPDMGEYNLDLTVIAWTRRIASRTYSYAAVKVGSQWWYTGKDREAMYGLSWEGLIEKLTIWNVEEIWVASEWETIPS